MKGGLASLLCLSISCFYSGHGMARDHALLIGGGYELDASQAQIELNLGWVQSILGEQGHELKVFYTDGADPKPDVFSYQQVEESAKELQPLARVFSYQYDNGVHYRNHRIEGVNASTQRETIEPALRDYFTGMGEGDKLLLVYNGHGAPTEGGSADTVALKLWGDTRLFARELHSILGESLDPEVPFRYVFTQCYSGGFHRLIFADPEQGSTLAEPMRCGFTAESSWRQSEGCSASIEMADYRDYTTYFFAALKGEDRLGRPLTSNPDRDGNGVTDLREAHFYTLEHAHSTDLSRSSSEEFLQSSVPWYLSWLSFPQRLPDNEYGALTRRLAKRLAVDTSALPGVARERLKSLRREHAALRARQLSTLDEAETLRLELKADLLIRYPQLSSPYTKRFAQSLFEELDEIQTWIVSDQRYRSLREAQDAEYRFDEQLLALERDIAQMQKLLRFRRLAFYQQWLYQSSSQAKMADYRRLLDCESAPL